MWMGRVGSRIGAPCSVSAPVAGSIANPLDPELISLTMTAVSHFREIFALSQ